MSGSADLFADPSEHDVDHLRRVFGEDVIGAIDPDELLGLVCPFEDVEGVLQGDDVGGCSVNEQPGDLY